MAYNPEQRRANRLYYLSQGRCPSCGGRNPLDGDMHRCRECATKQTMRRRELYALRRREGLCARCGAKMPENSEYVTCDACRTYCNTFKSFNKVRYEGLKADGKCVKCGGWAEPGRTMCRKCLNRHSEYVRSYGGYKEQKKARRDGYKAVGLCIDCGRPVEEEGHTRCKRCRDMRMDSTRKYRIRKRLEREAEDVRNKNQV